MGLELEAHLSARSSGPESANMICVIIYFQMGWTKHIFWKLEIPVISFFTFGAGAAAMEWGAWKSGAGSVNSGDTHLIPGLPDEMNITYHDIIRRPNHPPRSAGGGGGGPPKPGERPPWVPLVEGSIASMFNTCDDLERPLMNYLANQMGLPVWGVGPLLPNHCWSWSKTLIHDVQIRQPRNQSNYSEDQLLQWLDKKQEKYVLYVAFGSEVSPTKEEILQLAIALEELAYPFIWEVKNSNGDDQETQSFDLDDLGKKIGDRSLMIRGWAPQLLILSHPLVGGFLSHCGWNSTLEAIGHNVLILAWPIRGDQIYNAKLVVNHLKIGYMALPSCSPEMVKDDLRIGIEKLMVDEVVHERADVVRSKFSTGFPTSSMIALEAFNDFVKQNQT